MKKTLLFLILFTILVVSTVFGSGPYLIDAPSPADVYLGKGCTTAYHIDEDCDGYGIGDGFAVMTPDPDDTDPTVYNTLTAEIKWGDTHAAGAFTTGNYIANLKNFYCGTRGTGWCQIGNIYFVDYTNGVDVTGEVNNINKPFKTFNNAYSNNGTWSGGFTSGDMIILRGGTHGDNTAYSWISIAPVTAPRIHGVSSSKPNIVAGFPGERVIIYNSPMNNITGGDNWYWIFDTLQIGRTDADSTSGSGFHASGVHFLTVKNCFFTRNYETTFHQTGGVSTCKEPISVTEDLNDDGIPETRNLESCLCPSNVLYDRVVANAAQGTHTFYWGCGGDPYGLGNDPTRKTVFANATIRNCIFHSQTSSWDGFQMNGYASNWLIENNIIHSNGQDGINILNGMWSSVIRNNVVFNNSRSAFQFFIYATGGNDACTGGTATADTQDGSYVTANAFDNNNGTEWRSTDTATPHWIQYQFSSELSIKWFKIRGSSNPNYSPKNFTFSGSSNGSDWTLIATYTGTTWTANQEIRFSADNNSAYLYYRLNITANQSGNVAGISEIEMFWSGWWADAIKDNIVEGNTFWVGKNRNPNYTDQWPDACSAVWMVNGLYPTFKIRRNVVRNNVFVTNDNSSGAESIIYGDVQGNLIDNTFQNNVFWRTNGSLEMASWGSSPMKYLTLPQFETSPYILNSGNVFGNPLFTSFNLDWQNSPGKFNFQPSSIGSPVVNLGIPSAGLILDIKGVTRLGNPDSGAYEFFGGVPAGYTSLQTGTDTNKLILIFIPSGYTSAESSSFETKVTANLAKLWANNFFSQYQQRFDIYRVDNQYDSDGVLKLDSEVETLIDADTTCQGDGFGNNGNVACIHIVIDKDSSAPQSQTNDNFIRLRNDADSYYTLAHEIGTHVLGNLVPYDSQLGGPRTVDGYRCNEFTYSYLRSNVHDKNSNEKWLDLVGTVASCGGSYYSPSVTVTDYSSFYQNFSNVAYKGSQIGLAKRTSDSKAYSSLGTDFAGTKQYGQDFTKPTTSVVGIASSVLYSAPIDIVITPTDAGTGIDRVEFYVSVDGSDYTSFGVKHTSPYSQQLIFTNYPGSVYSVRIYTFDEAWNYKKDQYDSITYGTLGVVYYVDKGSGNCSDSYTTAQAQVITTPWCTISKAAVTIMAGDTVNIRAGTYYETLSPNYSGVSGKYITYQNYNNEVVTIDATRVITGWTNYSGNIYRATVSFAPNPKFIGNGFGCTPANGNLVMQDGAKLNYCMAATLGGVDSPGKYFMDDSGSPPYTLYVWLRDIGGKGYNPSSYTMKIAGTSWGTISSTGKSYIKFSGLNFFGGQGSGIWTSNYFWFTGCKFYSGYITGLYFFDNDTNMLIENCEFWDFGHAGIEFANSSYGTVRRNRFKKVDLGNGYGGSAAHISYNTGTNTFSYMTIENNLFEELGSDYMLGFTLRIQGSNNKIWHNTFYTDCGVLIPIINGGNNTIKNNIFYQGGIGVLVNVFPDAVSAGGNVFTKNIMYISGDSTGDYRWNGINYNTLSTWETASGQSGNLSSDPLFVNLSTRDLQISATSPAMNADNLGVGVTTDYDGTVRPKGSGYDIGAFECYYVTFQITTDVNANCKYNILDTTYDLMTSTFSTTGGTVHYSPVLLPCRAASYVYYTRCMDGLGNKSLTSTPISFNVLTTGGSAFTGVGGTGITGGGGIIILP